MKHSLALLVPFVLGVAAIPQKGRPSGRPGCLPSGGYGPPSVPGGIASGVGPTGSHPTDFAPTASGPAVGPVFTSTPIRSDYPNVLIPSATRNPKTKKPKTTEPAQGSSTRTRLPVQPTSSSTKAEQPSLSKTSSSKTKQPALPTSSSTQTKRPQSTSSSTRIPQPYQPIRSSSKTKQPAKPTSSSSRTKQPAQPTSSSTQTQQPYQPSTSSTKTKQTTEPTSTKTEKPVEATTTPGPKPSYGSPSGLPPSSGTSVLSAVHTIAPGESFDGGMVTYDRGVECKGQTEGGGSDAVFNIEEGGSLSNVIIGPNQIEGVHCQGKCTLTNVWWSAVCEDAFSIKKQAASDTTKIIGGGAFGAADKVIQFNGAGTVHVSGFDVQNFGKLVRSCGNCDTMYERHVVLDGITAVAGKVLVGINTNYGDTATLSSVNVSDVKDICVMYEGNDTGADPKEQGSGPDSKSCKYQDSDVKRVA